VVAMKKFLRLWPAFLLLLFLSIYTALAVPATQAFNTVILPVSDQSNAEFKKALSKGFAEMLIRLTGNTNVTTFPALQRVTKNPQQYVQYYRYLPTTDEDTSSTPSLRLQINFNEQAIRTLLTQANIPIWSEDNRPKTLIWIKTTQNNHAEFLSSTIDDPISSTVNFLATQYDLPILLPAMDLQDIQLSEQFANPYTQQPYPIMSNIDTLKEFMHRYRVNSILVGTINENTTSHQWESQWRLLFMDEMYQWSSTGKNSSDLIEKAFENTINILVNYTSNENQTSGEKIIFLHIFNVDNLKTYTELSKYIAQFNKVKNVSLENLSQTSIIFKLTLTNNTSTGLIQYLDKNRELHFTKQESTPFQVKKQDVQNIIPTLYYDYGQTITTQYQT